MFLLVLTSRNAFCEYANDIIFLWVLFCWNTFVLKHNFGKGSTSCVCVQLRVKFSFVYAFFAVYSIYHNFIQLVSVSHWNVVICTGNKLNWTVACLSSVSMAQDPDRNTIEESQINSLLEILDARPDIQVSFASLDNSTYHI